ncbi:MAG: hypothetical protein H6573_24775 [Lewinellaceae bacterium]|nr:hypothetical protein [Lewinellaceae bacterium]
MRINNPILLLPFYMLCSVLDWQEMKITGTLSALAKTTPSSSPTTTTVPTPISAT